MHCVCCAVLCCAVLCCPSQVLLTCFVCVCAVLCCPSQVLHMFFSAIFLKAFSLTFVAEWGDRSQITTIGCAGGQAGRQAIGLAGRQ